MSEQALDLRRSMQVVRRRWPVVAALAGVGLILGVLFTFAKPPMLTSQAWVALPPATHDVSTQVVIASSQPVLANAQLRHPMSLAELSSRIQVKSLTPTVIAVTAEAPTAADAEDIANAVAHSYISYVGSANIVTGNLKAYLLERAATATGTSKPVRLATTGGIGLLAGALVGAVFALALARNDRRLRERDEIADSIGIPVLASVPVARPSGAPGWTKLLETYEPGAVPAWRLRTAMHYLGLIDLMSATAGKGERSCTILTLSSDPGALGIGPQIAAFAASLGIPTLLQVDPREDINMTAALRTACSAPPSPRMPERLNIAVAGPGDLPPQAYSGLSVVVAVVDSRAPRVGGMMRTNATVIALSSGVVTGSQLALVAASAAADGRQIDGILVANPDPADRTTGRAPQLARPSYRAPTRLLGPTTPTRHAAPRKGKTAERDRDAGQTPVGDRQA
jgi:capsular polysaccharide biosynthesis protein